MIKYFKVNYFRHELPESLKSYKVPVRDTASIILITEGSAEYYSEDNPDQKRELSPGAVVFIPANNRIDLSFDDHVILFQAYCEL